MKLKFNLHERLVFLNILPKENSFATLRILREVAKEVGITDEEYKYYGITTVKDGKVSFNPEKSAEEKEFKIRQVALELVKKELKKLDTEEKLTGEHFSLYEKIFDEKVEDNEDKDKVEEENVKKQ